MPRMRLQFGYRKNLAPARPSCQLVGRGIRRDASFDRAGVGIVSFEVIGIDFDLSDRARQPQFQNDPIVSRTAPAFCFPAVAHVFRTSGHDQVVHRTKKHVAAGERHSAILDRGKIDQFARFHLAPIGHHHAVDAEAGHAAVRENIQPHDGSRSASFVIETDFASQDSAAIAPEPASRKAPRPRPHRSENHPTGKARRARQTADDCRENGSYRYRPA